jgi:biopolymer transport protein ExbD
MKLRHRSSEKRVEVNITPLIDVVFLLLIFFMVSTTFNRESELQINLPLASAGSVELPPELVEIVIAKDGSFVIAGKPLRDTDALTVQKALAAAVGSERDQPVVLRADGETPHQSVITAMDAARKLGISKLTFATQLDTE